MPIKPENRARYPANWKFIRARILDRAGYCCEKCSAPNGKIIARGYGIDAGTYQTEDAEVYSDETGEHLGRKRMSEYYMQKMVEIVLTVAHLDHIPENCDGMEKEGALVLPVEESNLRAWCQRCHLRYDAKHHAETARATRHARKAIGELFESEKNG